jgi:hypothetical protein
MGGLKVLDVSNPAQPTMIGERDTVYANEWSYSVAVDDSFAFMGWFNTPFFRTVDVSNPTRPAFAGSCDPFEFAQDMVLRDSFVYCAESYKFQVVNVARPLAPAVVGTCGLPDYTFDLYLWDTLAYVANSYNLNILDITQPANPQLVGTLNGYPNAMDRRDTFMFVVSDFWLVSYSVADPVQPRALDSVSLTGHMHDVLVLDSIAYCGGWVMQMVDVADPQNMRVLPETWVPPSWIRRIVYAPPYLYTCCTEGGVCIMETLQTGIAEPGRAEGEQAQKGASVVSGVLFLPEASGHEPQAASWLLDISGRKVLDLHPGANDVRALAPGVYFVRQALGVKRGAPDVTKVIIAQ